MAAVLPLPAAPDPAQLPLPALRSDLHILRVGTFRDGSPRYRIHDPLRNRYFELGQVDVDVLAHWQGGESAIAMATRLAAAGEDVAVEDILGLRELLVRYQLVDASGPANFAMLRELWLRQRLHWLTWLLHHYLFFRIPLLRPDALLVKLLPAARLLVSLPVRVLLLVLALVTPVLLAREWTDYTQAFAGLLTLEGIVASAVAAFFAKILHECGHAFVARAHGVRVPVMGLGFLVMWPVLYTDTSDSWKLPDHRARFRIAAAGIATEGAIALVALFLWTITPPGGLRSALFFLSTTSLLITLSLNASPFMRFDGYFLLSDALDFPHLHERAGAQARWWLRRTLWGRDVPPPESHGRRFGRFLVAFALVTWAYRAVVFFGIALLVYLAFFKLLGIALMAVELGWFIARPVWSEARDLWRMRRELHPRWLRLFALLALAGGGLTLLAWAGEARAPGLLMTAEETRLYAPSPARLAELRVQAGQQVRQGEVLMVLEAPDLAFRAQANEVGVARIQGELARIASSDRQRERALVLQEELAEALSQQQGIREEQALLTVRAAQAGRVTDLPADLVPGRWLHPRQLLGRVVATRAAQVRAWVSESQVKRLHVGQQLQFVPQMPELPRIAGRVVRVDTTGSRLLPHQLLAAQHGGPLVATQNARGGWELHETLYQVDLDTGAAPPPAMLSPGVLHVPTGPLDAVTASVRQLLTVLVRESGF
jgi:putative peptide zinc metalloprotease protein